MKYCDNRSGFTDIWVNDGINECFLDTISASIIFAFLFICGCLQCSMYRKYSTGLESKYVTSNFGSVLQTLLTVLMLCLSLCYPMIKDLMKIHGGVSGYDILTFLCFSIAWIMALRILSLERKNQLPTIPTSGHGLVLLMFWTLAFLRENLSFISWNSSGWWWAFKSDSDHVEFGLWVGRYSCTALLFLLGLKAPGMPAASAGYSALKKDDEEAGGSEQKDKGPQKHVGSTWSNVWKKLKTMMPYVWPKGSFYRQLIVVICIVILGAGRGINVLVPIYNKKIVDSLTYNPKSSSETSSETVEATAGPQFRWDFILVYCALLFLKGSSTGGSGFLNNIRTLMWIPVQQYTTRRVQVKLFSHLHSLSLSWHLQRKTGEVLRVVDRGTNSINNLLNYVIFQIVPTIIDIIIAIVYFVTVFNYIFGVVVFVAMALYLTVTIAVTEWRTKYRREMNTLDNATNSKAVDSLLNFETVKYYGASEFEIDRYNKAILKYQKAELKATASLNLLNTAQNVVITGGVVAGSLLCAWAVVHSLNGLHLTVGDYVLFGSYIIQLYSPLNFLGTYYRMIQQAFIDMENMFELLEVGLEIKDVPGAINMNIHSGEIEFKDVSFHYDPSKKILKDVSFKVPAGHTYALVGHSGSGKSTIIRLLFRFYDVQDGTITIDDQNIALDTVLFNDNILYNVRYGRQGASDKEVYDATEAADIHQRILGFPNKYETTVGERGLKLSGGEKQRVAIARTLLKAPAIVLLDEATSALDTKTERNIQSSLARVCENRTTIIVAHRLSTIIHAHQILVLDEGEIVERGTHEELIQGEGHYYEMWQQQVTNNGEEVNNDNNSLNIDDDASKTIN